MPRTARDSCSRRSGKVFPRAQLGRKMDDVAAAVTVAVACVGVGASGACSLTGTSTGTTDEVLGLRAGKESGETPETGTTPARSLSPSSDGDTSLPLSQRGAHVSGSSSSALLGGRCGNAPRSAVTAISEQSVTTASNAEVYSETLTVCLTPDEPPTGERRVETAVFSDGSDVEQATPGTTTALTLVKQDECSVCADDGRADTNIADTTPTSIALTSESTPTQASGAECTAMVGGKSPRSQDLTTSSALPSTEPEASETMEVTVSAEVPARTAGPKDKDGDVTDDGCWATNPSLVDTTSLGGARASRAKAPSRGGHGGGTEKCGQDSGSTNCSSVAAVSQVSDGLRGDGTCSGGLVTNDHSQANMPVSAGTAAFALLPPVPSLGPTMNSFSDRRIIEVLAAPESTHLRLVATAKRVPEILSDPGEHALVSCTELYGSLSLDMSEPNALRPWKQDWASYYVNGRSDVDFVVKTRHKVSPSAVAQRLLKKGPWRMIGQVQVHKFASTQFTLLGSFEDEGGGGQASEVYLDITCIEQTLHFNRFKNRQEAFRKVFMEVRSCIEGQYAAQGALAFDAYIHLLKAFAAKVPGNALTGFQATCIGLFTLQIGHFRMKPTQSIALSLFEGFLGFCVSFYSDMMRPADLGWHSLSYRQCAIDLSVGGRWLPRMSTTWHSELYFMAEEVKMQTRPDERMNVTHSLDPARVSVEALALLNRAFFSAALPTGTSSRTIQQPASARSRAGDNNTDSSSPFSFSQAHRDSTTTGRTSEMRESGADVGCSMTLSGGKGCIPVQCMEFVG